jgi:membrane protein required for colicin V production
MNSIDIALIVLLILATLRGLWRGLIRESFGLVALIGGLVAALKLSNAGATVVGGSTGLPPATVAAITFVAIFMVVHGGITLVGFGLDRVTGSSVRAFSRIAGAVFGFAKGGMLLAFVLLFLDLFPVVPEIKPQLRASQLARPLVSLAETIVRAGADKANHSTGANA